MADTETPSEFSDKSANFSMFVVGGLLVGGFLLLAALGSGARDRAIDNSPIGFKGLGIWLVQSDVQARVSHPRLSPDVADLALRVLPLFDLDLQNEFATPDTKEDEMNSGEQRDITAEIYHTKISEIPTIVVLPKWRGAIIETEIAHEQALTPLEDFRLLLGQLDLSGTKLARGGAEFATDQSQNGTDIALFHAQTFRSATLPKNCRSVVPFHNDALVISCKRDDPGHPVYFVADPDLLNNHGLAVAVNAAFATAFISDLLGDDSRPVYVDQSAYLLTSTNRVSERRDYDRGTEELSRFLEYPFAMFWAVLLIVLAVLFWRGARRFGPVVGGELQARELSKRASITAKARLLRLSGNDGRMVAEFVRSQLHDLGVSQFGNDAGQGAEARLMKLIGRRDPTLANDFSAAAQGLLQDAPNMPPHQLHRHFATYQTLLKKVMDHHGPV